MHTSLRTSRQKFYIYKKEENKNVINAHKNGNCDIIFDTALHNFITSWFLIYFIIATLCYV